MSDWADRAAERITDEQDGIPQFQRSAAAIIREEWEKTMPAETIQQQRLRIRELEAERDAAVAAKATAVQTIKAVVADKRAAEAERDAAVAVATAAVAKATAAVAIRERFFDQMMALLVACDAEGVKARVIRRLPAEIRDDLMRHGAARLKEVQP
jgi:hypothetical protein